MLDLSYFHNKRILVTGASGIVGFNLCKKLKGLSEWTYINYLNSLDKSFGDLESHFHHRVFDITNLESIKALPKFDVIFHCSGYGQPIKFTKNPEKTFSLNTLSTYALLEKLEEGGKFIFISTSEVYADGEGNKETDKITINPENTRNCYTLSKIFGESALSLSGRNIDHKSIRLCLCYGPGFKKDDKRVLSEFVMGAIDKKEISLMDDGSGLRSYIYVNDCIGGILNIALSGKHNLYNIGGKDIITIRQLAEEISSIVGCSIKLGDKKNKLINSPSKAFVDISRYEEEFGVLNSTNLKDGLVKCIDWYKNYD
jgi:nucleoside-diphosphate-sugar epimerase